jgi:hypothetical protein
MYHNPTFLPDRGQALMEIGMQNHQSNEARIQALETLMTEILTRVAAIELKVVHIRHRLRMDD